MATGRTRRHAEAQNLDSLLDTMANVTGILVVMLAVTQISMGDAMGRLRELLAQRPELTPESLALAEAEAADLHRELAPLVVLQDPLRSRRRQGREENVALRAENTRLRSEVEAARALDPNALRDRIRSAVARERELESALSGARAELSALEQQIEALERSPARREARLPDPQAAPAGAREIVVLCRFGHVVRIDDQGLLSDLAKGVERALGQGGDHFDLSLLSIGDRIRLQSHFERIPIGRDGLRWQIRSDPRGQLVGELVWQRESLGEDESELARASSDFQRELRRISPSRAFFRFLVWEDSFEAYRVARSLADEARFASGWVPFAEDRRLLQPLTRTVTSPRLVD